MKRFLQLVLKVSAISLVTISAATLVGCADEESPNPGTGNDTQIEETTPTNFETIQDFIENFEIPNKDGLISNIYLPKTIGEDGSISWETSDDVIISTGGIVTRPQEDTEITLTALVTLGGSKARFYYDVKVLRVPEAREDRFQEAIDSFYLTEEIDGVNVIDRDVMTLPRVTDVYTVYIDWETSDDTIIDLEGTVYRSNVEQQVTLTATFSYYEYSYNDDYTGYVEYLNPTGVDESAITDRLTQEVEYDIVVGSKTDDSVAVIDKDAPGILREVKVTSDIELYGAMNNAVPGDAIVLADGEYKAIQYVMEKSGTEENPIYIYAENPGEVRFTGVCQLQIKADYVTVANIRVENGYPLTDMGVFVFQGHYDRLTNCSIVAYEKSGLSYKWVSLTGSHHEIDRNYMGHKTTGGALLTIWREDMERNYHYIHLNHFDDFSEGSGNGFETIRIGTSDYSQTDSNTLVENNLFEDINGEIEIISIKSGRVIVKGNTFNTCLGLITFRHGKNNIADSNIFYGGGQSNSGGVRMYDGGHIVRNNYMYRVGGSTGGSRSAIVVHTGLNAPNAALILNLQWTTYNVLLENNTIYNSSTGVNMCANYTMGTTSIHLVNNLIAMNSSTAPVYDGSTTSGTQHTQIYHTGNEYYTTSNAVTGGNAKYGLTHFGLDSSYTNNGTYDTANSTYGFLSSNGFKEYSQTIGASNLVEMTSENTGVSFVIFED